MSVRIDILEGAEKGLQFLVHGPDTRIGSAAEHAVRVCDPAWPGGSLRILRKLGGYMIVNETPRCVYLDRRQFLPGTAETLHHDATLQPTAQTLLRVRIEAGAAAGHRDGVERIAAAPPKKSNATNWLLLAVLAGLAAWILLGPKPNPFTPEVQAEAETLKAALAEIQMKADGKARSHWQNLQMTLRDAVYDEAMQHPHQAYAKYLILRDEVTSLHDTSGDTEVRQTLRRVKEFVLARLLATAQPKPVAKRLLV